MNTDVNESLMIENWFKNKPRNSYSIKSKLNFSLRCKTKLLSIIRIKSSILGLKLKTYLIIMSKFLS